MKKDTRIMILGAVVAIGIIVLSIITTIKSGENRKLRYENERLVQKVQGLEAHRDKLINRIDQLDEKIGDLIVQKDMLSVTDKAQQDMWLSDTPSLPDLKLHVVKKGDWLSKLAITYYGKEKMDLWWLIWDANKNIIDNPDLIYPGQVLIIPRIKIIRSK